MKKPTEKETTREPLKSCKKNLSKIGSTKSKKKIERGRNLNRDRNNFSKLSVTRSSKVVRHSRLKSS